MLDEAKLWTRAPELGGLEMEEILRAHINAEAKKTWQRVLAEHATFEHHVLELPNDRATELLADLEMRLDRDIRLAIGIVHGRRVELVQQGDMRCENVNQWLILTAHEFSWAMARANSHARTVSRGFPRRES